MLHPLPFDAVHARFRRKAFIACVSLLACMLVIATASHAQQPGTPGTFDFYLLDMPWGPRFCEIKDVSRDCTPQPGFVLHGLWPQNNNGSWPAFCSKEAGPADYTPYLKLTPDMQLLHHEWDKHGTCSAVGPARFFRMEEAAFKSIAVPKELTSLTRDETFTPEWLVELFQFANPSLPRGSLALSCSDGKLTAVEACFDKDLHAIKCVGLQPCTANAVTVQASMRASDARVQ